LIDPDPNGQTKTRISCFVEVEPIPGLPGARTCVNSATLELQLADQPCALAGIAAMSKPGFATFASSFPIPTSINGATITPKTVEASLSCKFLLEPSNAEFVSTPPPTLHTALKIDVSPSTPGERFMLIPLDVTFVQGDCGDPTERGCDLIREVGEKVTECGL
jgi:hypothetical protein